MAGTQAFNGTNVFLRVNNGSIWLSVGGQLSHTETLSNGLIDITTKSNGAGQPRELLEDEGNQDMVYSVEILFVDQAGYDFVRQLAANQSQAVFQVLFTNTPSGSDYITVELILQVQSFLDTSNNNDPFKGTVEFLSSDSFEFSGETNFANFLTASLEPFKTASNEQFVVRVSA